MSIVTCCRVCCLLGAEQDASDDAAPNHPANLAHRGVARSPDEWPFFSLDSLDPRTWLDSTHLLERQRLGQALDVTLHDSGRRKLLREMGNE